MQERKKRSAKLDETAIVSSETMKAIKVLMDQLWLDGKKREFIYLLFGMNTPIGKESIVLLQMKNLELKNGKFTGKITVVSGDGKENKFYLNDKASEFVNNFIDDEHFIGDKTNGNEYLFKHPIIEGRVLGRPIAYETLKVYLSTYITKKAKTVQPLVGLTMKKYMMEKIYYTGMRKYFDQLIEDNPYRAGMLGHTLKELENSGVSDTEWEDKITGLKGILV